jgi:hypothetical protein
MRELDSDFKMSAFSAPRCKACSRNLKAFLKDSIGLASKVIPYRSSDHAGASH